VFCSTLSLNYSGAHSNFDPRLLQGESRTICRISTHCVGRHGPCLRFTTLIPKDLVLICPGGSVGQGLSRQRAVLSGGSIEALYMFQANCVIAKYYSTPSALLYEGCKVINCGCHKGETVIISCTGHNLFINAALLCMR